MDVPLSESIQPYTSADVQEIVDAIITECTPSTSFESDVQPSISAGVQQIADPVITEPTLSNLLDQVGMFLTDVYKVQSRM